MLKIMFKYTLKHANMSQPRGVCSPIFGYNANAYVFMCVYFCDFYCS